METTTTMRPTRTRLRVRLNSVIAHLEMALGDLDDDLFISIVHAELAQETLLSALAEAKRIEIEAE